MLKWIFSVMCAGFLLLLCACMGTGAGEGAIDTKASDTSYAPIVTDVYVHPTAEIVTDCGSVFIELYENRAPNTVANFKALVDTNFYDGLAFHRVIQGFMGQIGCPHSAVGGDADLVGTGTCGYFIDNEISPDLLHKAGYLNMGQSGPNRVSSHFCFFFDDAPHLDGDYTVFGRVISGYDVLAQLEAIGSLGDPHPPTQTVRIRDILFLNHNNHDYTVVRNDLN